MSVYVTGEVQARLRQAQRVIDDHLRTDPGARCVSCGEPEPCAVRQAAGVLLARYHRLPYRVPGRAMAWCGR
jgi:hypothetical protein